MIILKQHRTLAARLFAAAMMLAAAGSALADVHYVDVNSTNATPPYTNWTTAATNIQDAVDAAVAGDEIVVTNGVYATGARDNDAGSSRVVVDKPLNLRSVNGPQSTAIKGGYSVRCVYLTNGASLSGFTLTNGVAVDSGISYVNGGGGVWCAASDAVVSNCVIWGNQASTYWGDACGGGAYGGTLNNCTLVGNSVHYVVPGFPISDVTAFGGGAAYCTLNRCMLSRNSVAFNGFVGETAAAEGGGAAWCTLNNCTLTGNSASVFFGPYPACGGVAGGGAFQCMLNNCTVAGNSAALDGSFPLGCGGIYGGGTAGCMLTNCIRFENTYWPPMWSGSHEVVCEDCGWDPLFVNTNGWANLRLQPNSPCINAGNNSYVTGATDLDGNPRIAGGTVDIGAYEYQWPQLTLTPSGPNVLLRWPTNYAGYDYTGFTLQSTTNLGLPVWITNSPAPVVVNGQNTVTNPITGPRQFFRLSQQ